MICSFPNTLASHLPLSCSLPRHKVHSALALNYPEALTVVSVRDLLLTFSSRSFLSVESCQSLHSSLCTRILTHPEKTHLFLLKFFSEPRFKVMGSAGEVCISCPILHKALLLWFTLAFPLLEKKGSVFYKNPARAGLVAWDFLRSK